ncbi:MAG: hypothetical protein J5859_01425 [Clostridia bacterium]|nr:hypothetical protein [Clostridia bacterium]
MNEKQIFYRDMNGCRIPPVHIADAEPEEALRETDELYAAADTLSLLNAERHRRVLLALSAAATALTFAFLLYDEAEMHGLILACGVMLVCMFLIRRMSDRLDCHRKYLQYRVLAECLRCRYFLSYAGIKTPITEILPWTVRKGIPWIADLLSSLPEGAASEMRPVLDAWVRAQKAYHEEALVKTQIKSRRDDRIAKTVRAVTVVVYMAALVYELFLYGHAEAAGNADEIRAFLKILLGTMSAVALFTGSYYGKMSLSHVIDDHKRMTALFEKAEQDIRREGESEEILLFLARECMNENSAWYAYQSKNTADISI